jgi:hypothetical protein
VSQPDGPEYFRDIDTYHGNKGIACHITGRITCLMSCHPHFLRVETNNTENEDPLQFWWSFYALIWGTYWNSASNDTYM